MKKTLIIFVIGIFSNSYSQIGIGTTNPNPSSIVDMDVSTQTTKKGFLPPLVSLTDNADITTISNPTNGMTAYNLNDGGSGLNFINGNRISYWDTNKWQSLTSLGEIRSLRQSIDYINSTDDQQNFTTDGVLSNFNNGELVIVEWSNADIVIPNTNDISLENNVFTIKTPSAYQLSGSIIVKPIINSTENTQIIMVIQTSTDGSNWTNIFGLSTPVERLIANKAQTLAIPQILHRFAANTQMRIALYKPQGATDVQANSGIIVNNTGDSSKSIRLTRIRE